MDRRQEIEALIADNIKKINEIDKQLNPRETGGRRRKRKTKNKENEIAEKMCMKIDCAQCGKPTWKGCGKHIEEALKGVPVDERCKCSKDSTVDPAKIEENK